MSRNPYMLLLVGGPRDGEREHYNGGGAGFPAAEGRYAIDFSRRPAVYRFVPLPATVEEARAWVNEQLSVDADPRALELFERLVCEREYECSRPWP